MSLLAGEYPDLMATYRDLQVWQLSMELVEAAYRATEALPKHELYALTSQMRRAAVSIPSNIAEGNGRQHRKDYANFVSNANGSLRELETTILLAQRLYELQAAEDLLRMGDRVGQMLTKLRRSLLEPAVPNS